MSTFSDDLLRASSRLLGRRKGQKGPLKGAYVRRSISTTYYALFHFLIDETAGRLVGSGNDLRQRRRLFIRTLSHAGLTTTFGKLKGATIDASVVDLFRLPSVAAGSVPTPPFLQQVATAYLDARAKREDADYNLSEPLSETDARQLRRRVTRAIGAWKAANTASDRDSKHALALLVSLRGQLRS
ncbi:hypothetical protein Q8W71_12215 [Methylobacterium sp. NEAU 140]|uniref:hypothetical protein n=1 Tax=Methylobacterium sp. NEAU 140 TaxID=3064945 RepID=UPI002733F6F1|nr:hypothetical protein [Methylobacterium sp. NEAU 140]MDP4023394.1 hypothetical protein [Methylobacterium sp. NEAU 140]